MIIHIFIARMGIGGAERVCVNLANEFAAKGHEVHIVVLNLDNDVNTHLLDSRVRVHPLGVSRLRYAAPTMLRYVKKYRPPFLFVFGNEMAVILNKMRKLHLLNTPLVVRVLNNVNISGGGKVSAEGTETTCGHGTCHCTVRCDERTAFREKTD